MQTVLLSDDERVFKAIEGTCLRRDVCRLIKVAPERLEEAARSERPQLIIVAIENDAERRSLRALRESKPPIRTPIIALDLAAGEPAGDAGTVEWLRVKKQRSGQVDHQDLDGRLEESIRRHLPVMDRRVDRVTVSVPVRCHGGGLTFTLRTKNISPSGMFLKTERDLSPGEKIQVRFDLPRATAADTAGGATIGTGSITATCQIVRRVGLDADDLDLIPGIGVRFIDLEEDGQRALRRFVRAGASPDGASLRAARGAHASH